MTTTDKIKQFLDRKSLIPLQTQIVMAILDMIWNCCSNEAVFLPAPKQLAVDLKVKPWVTMSAYRDLQLIGMIKFNDEDCSPRSTAQPQSPEDLVWFQETTENRAREVAIQTVSLAATQAVPLSVVIEQLLKLQESINKQYKPPLQTSA